MGLKFSEDIEAWHKWAEKQNILRYTKLQILRLLKKQGADAPAQLVLFSKSEEPPKVLVALEAFTPTQLASLLLPGNYLEDQGIALGVLAPLALESKLVDLGYKKITQFLAGSLLPDELAAVEQVISVGHYISVGEWTYARSREKGWDFNVIQHGLNTPYAPPLPSGATLFAFSQADADFWISGRKDVEVEVVGSQLFYEALQQPKVAAEDIAETPIFLGQMHGAELPRLSFARASFDIVKNHGAIYRPHPSEKDKLSLMTHKLWAKMGATIDTSSRPLNQLNNPVVSVFSTGVLEAAIRGIPAWVYHPNPPAWLLEFWDRYGMSRWGGVPTAAPAMPEVEPAKVIAQKIAQKLEK